MSSTTFFQLLESRAREIDSLLCIGLDPHPADLLDPTPDGVREFCLRLIQATYTLAVAYKPNSAFFEAFGPPGLAVLKEVIAAVPTGIPVILDAKRGDIASTAQAYAQAAFSILGAQAITLNPYLGFDSLAPFLADPSRGVFLLCKTSNPGAADLQDLRLAPGSRPGDTVYEVVAYLAQGWNRQGNLGLVVGATHPEALRRARALAPDLWILAPGVGAQGGDVQDALQAGLREDGLGLLIPVSRLISRAPDPHQAAEDLRQAINRVRRMERSMPLEPPTSISSSLAALADSLLDCGCVRFGNFTLKSGLVSPIYIDLRRLVSFPASLALAAEAYLPLLDKLTFDRMAALPYAALPIAAAIGLKNGRPWIYPRKEAKAYGTRAEIEGVFNPGERVVVIDDLATTGGSKFEGIQKLAGAGLQVSDVVVLIDRQSGAAGALAAEGYCLHAVFTLTQLLDHWEASGIVSPEEIAAAREFINGEYTRNS